MANLLPEQYIASLKRERIMRIAVVSVLTLTGALVVVGLLLLPSYFVARSNEVSRADEIAVLQKVLEKREQGDAASEARQLRTELSAVQSYFGNESVIDVIADVQGALPPNVRLVQIISGSETVQIDGVAGTRDSLLAYRRSLEALPRFGNIPIEISTLAQQFDIAFSLKVPVTTDAAPPQETARTEETSRPEIQGT